jgi:formate dehydrogenase subunit delta
MNTDLMIKMLNEIGAFFEAEPDREAAARDVKGHVRRYWEPRMRAQLLEYFEQRQGAGLSELAVQAVELLAAEARAAAAGPSATQAPATSAAAPAASPNGAPKTAAAKTG